MNQTSIPSTRRHHRADLDVFVNKIVGDEPHMARVRDISTDGLYLYRLIEPETNRDDPVGLEIMLPQNNDVIWAVGKVVRTERNASTDGVAVRFTRIAETDRQRIRTYVDSVQSANKV